MAFIINQTVKLTEPGSTRVDYGAVGYEGNERAHKWVVTLEDGEDFLAECPFANILYILPDGTRVAGTASRTNNVLSATFPQAVYSIAGMVEAFMYVEDSASASTLTTSVTVAAIRFMVMDTGTGEIHVPEDVVLPLSDLMAKYTELTTKYKSLSDLDAAQLEKVGNALVVDTDAKTVSAADGYKIKVNSESENWSEEVTECGTWIDGKTVYRKTFVKTAVAGSTSKATDTTISSGVIAALGIETVARIDGAAIQSNGVCNTIPTYYGSDNFKNAYINSSGDLVYRHYDSSSTNTNDIYVTVWYTVA